MEHKKQSYVLGCALLISLNSTLAGYAIGIITGAILFIKEDLQITEVQQEILVGCVNLVSFIGCVIAGRLSDVIGRNKSMGIGTILFAISSTAMGLAPNFTLLLCGRALSGIAVGFALVIIPVFLAELAPTESRGALASLPEVFINIGILLGYLASYLLANWSSTINWKLMLGFEAPVALFLCLISLMTLPESPRWLVMHCRLDEARVVLNNVSKSEKEAEERLDAIKRSWDETTEKQFTHGEKVWKELLLPKPAVGKMLIVALGVHFFQQATGIDVLVFYSPHVLFNAGMKNKSNILGLISLIGFVKTLFIFVATALLDRLGRRPLLLISGIGMMTCSIILAITMSLQNVGPAIAMLAICLFMMSFSVGFGPVAHMLTSEIFPLHLRSQASGLGVIINRTTGGLLASTYLSISGAITPAGAFLAYSIIAAASVVFVFTLVPETKGKSLEEISQFFEEGETTQDPMTQTLLA